MGNAISPRGDRPLLVPGYSMGTTNWVSGENLEPLAPNLDQKTDFLSLGSHAVPML
ncbi:MAG: hypothetical protein ACRC8Y_03750 [Chroococcales cyanobacterium]